MNGCWKKIPAERVTAGHVAKTIHELIMALPVEEQDTVTEEK